MLVSESIEADRCWDASKRFDEHLLTVADAISVVLGAAVVPRGASTLIEKRRSKYIFINAVNRREAASMTIVPGHHDHILRDAADAAVVLASDQDQRSAAHYLRQAGTTDVLTTGVFHLLQAAEALCPRTEKGKRTRRTDSNAFGIFSVRSSTRTSTRTTRYFTKTEGTPWPTDG